MNKSDSPSKNAARAQTTLLYRTK